MAMPANGMDRLLLPSGLVSAQTIRAEKESQPMEARNYAPALISIGIDIAKDVFHLAGFGADAKNRVPSQDDYGAASVAAALL